MTYNLLHYRDILFSEKPAKVILFYKKHQEIYNEMMRMKLIDDMIEIDEKMVDEKTFENMVSPYKDKGGSLCVFDDLMELIDETNSKIFTKIAHHEKCNVIFLTQSLFVDNKYYRVMSRNTTYMIVMKNPRDVTQIKSLSSQMCSDRNMLVEAYKEATKRPYSYLLIDFHPETPEHIRLRSDIFPNQWPVKVYLHKNSMC